MRVRGSFKDPKKQNKTKDRSKQITKRGVRRGRGVAVEDLPPVSDLTHGVGGLRFVDRVLIHNLFILFIYDKFLLLLYII